MGYENVIRNINYNSSLEVSLLFHNDNHIKKEPFRYLGVTKIYLFPLSEVNDRNFFLKKTLLM